jgi:hypothetical protein
MRTETVLQCAHIPKPEPAERELARRRQSWNVECSGSSGASRRRLADAARDFLELRFHPIYQPLSHGRDFGSSFFSVAVASGLLGQG